MMKEMSNSPRIVQEPRTVANYCMFNINEKYKVSKPKTRSTLSSPKHSIFSFAGPSASASPIPQDKIQTKVIPQQSQRQGQLSLSPLQLSLQRSLATITPTKVAGPPAASNDEEKEL